MTKKKFHCKICKKKLTIWNEYGYNLLCNNCAYYITNYYRKKELLEKIKQYKNDKRI